MRNGQVSRIYRILTLLESTRNGLTVKEIHDRIQAQDDVTDRTVRRDLEAIEQAGFPIDRTPNPNDPQAGDRFSIQSSLRVSKHLTLQPRELFALYLSKGMLTPLKDTAFFGDLEKVFQQIDSLLPKASREHLDELSEEMKFEPGPRWGLGVDPDLLETVIAACTNVQVLDLEYQSALKGERTRRRLGPHFLYFAKGSVYLVAEDLGDQQLKVFSVARCSDASMSDEPYSKSQIEPEDFFKGSFGVYRADTTESVELLFKKESSAYVSERRWHASQRLVKHSDGKVSLFLEVGITPDLVQFVLGFGDTVEVKAPASLKAKVVEAAAKISAIYAKS